MVCNVYRLVTTTRFEKDVKLAKKRGKDLSRLRKLMELLVEGKEITSLKNAISG
jgi:mRNA-degrading endonuclease YafQ of YafQ-DinJ toxin-antitoxin module